MAVLPLDRRDAVLDRFRFVFEPSGTPVFWRMVVDPAPSDLYAQRYERSRQAIPRSSGKH